MKLYQKIHNCRAGIKASNLKKQGTNTYSNYDYYTPEQVNKLVYDVCLSEKLFTKFDLVRGNNGLHGKLTVIDLETGEQDVFTAATEMPVITATNASQQMGGCMTFSERYLKQSVFEIVDNNLDFDSQDNRPQKPAKKPQGKKTYGDKEWLNPTGETADRFKKVKAAIANGECTLKDVMRKYGVSKTNQAILSGKDVPADDAGNLPINPYVQGL